MEDARHLAGHIATALEQHRVWLRRTAIPEPAGLDMLVALYTGCAQGSGELVPPPPAPHVDRLALTMGEAAAALGVSLSAVQRLTRSGELPTVRLGGSVRVRVAALHELLKRQESFGDERCATRRPGRQPVRTGHARSGATASGATAQTPGR